MSDDDDVCAHPTQGGDGPPCQHPTTDDGDADRCWIDDHNDSETDSDGGGRPLAIDESDHEDILDAARDGFSKAGCARAAGATKDSLRRYLEADGNEEFRAAFMRARHKGERTLVKGPMYEEKNNPEPRRVVDGQHARFLLSTSFDYQKTEKRELEDVTEGEGGFGTNIIVSGDYDPDDGDE